MPRQPLRVRRLLPIAVTLLVLAGGLFLTLVANCSLNFGTALSPDPLPSGPRDLLEGRWSGTWSSTSRNDGGRLVCTIRKREDGTYQATFKASFAKVFAFTTRVVLRVTKGQKLWRLRGKEDLGWLRGGVYKYEGYVKGDEFYSTYDSKFDKGVFRMTRVKAAGASPRNGP